MGIGAKGALGVWDTNGFEELDGAAVRVAAIGAPDGA